MYCFCEMLIYACRKVSGGAVLRPAAHGPSSMYANEKDES